MTGSSSRPFFNALKDIGMILAIDKCSHCVPWLYQGETGDPSSSPR